MSESKLCERCGSFGEIPHVWIEGDCVLPHKGHHWATIGLVCGGCVLRHVTALAEVVELFATLDQVLDPTSIPDDTAEHAHVKKKPASPAPMRLEAWAMLNDRARMGVVTRENGVTTAAYLGSALPDVPVVLAGWADHLWELLGYTGQAPTTVSGAAAVLTVNAETIARSPLVDDYDAELKWLRQALRAAHAITDQRPLGDCITVDHGADCGGQVWEDRDGGKPRCDRCKRRYGTLDLVRVKAMGRTA